MESITLNPNLKLLIHTLCEIASKQEMNSASIVEAAVKVYLALFHDTTLTIIKAYFGVDLNESTQPAKFESKNQITSRLFARSHKSIEFLAP